MGRRYDPPFKRLMAINGKALRPLIRLLSLPGMAPAVVFGAALAVYLLAAPRGLTWAYNSADGGDLIAAALVTGVPHPTGYPTYTLLARLFARLPWGEPAWRVMLLSAFSAALAAALVAASVSLLGDDGTFATQKRDRGQGIGVGQGSPAGRRPYPLSSVLILPVSVVSGLLLAYTPLLWSQATVAEVYALNGAFAALLIWSLARWRRHGGRRWIASAGLVLGLALGNHVTIIWLLPLALAWLLGDRPAGEGSALRRLALFAVGLATGLLVYAYLPLAAAGRPPVNWGNPVTWQGFWWLVSGQLYRTYALALPAGEIPARLAAWAGLLWRDFLPWGLALIFAGLVLNSRRDRSWPGLPLAGALTSLALLLAWTIGYNTSDSHLALLPAWVLLAVWAGLGLATLAGWLAKQAPAGRGGAGSWLVGLLCLALIAIPIGRNWPELDIHEEREAEDFLAFVLEAAEPEALLVMIGDRATFSLWYARYGLERRPDLTPLNRDLWGFTSYRETMSATHPQVVGDRPPEALADLIAAEAAQGRPVYIVQAGEFASGPAQPEVVGLDENAYRLQTIAPPLDFVAEPGGWHLWRLHPEP